MMMNEANVDNDTNHGKKKKSKAPETIIEENVSGSCFTLHTNNSDQAQEDHDGIGGGGSFVTLTLTLPPSQTYAETNNSNGINNSNGNIENSKSSYKLQKQQLKQQFDSTCQKWGMIVVRELVYVQSTIFEHCDGNNEGNDDVDANADKKSNSIVIDGCEAIKMKDQLVVSQVVSLQQQQQQQQQEEHNNEQKEEIDLGSSAGSSSSLLSSPAQIAGIQPGDIIHAIYGMANPKLGLLFGIMRDSITFQITVQRKKCHCFHHDNAVVQQKGGIHPQTQHHQGPNSNSNHNYQVTQLYRHNVNEEKEDTLHEHGNDSNDICVDNTSNNEETRSNNNNNNNNTEEDTLNKTIQTEAIIESKVNNNHKAMEVSTSLLPSTPNNIIQSTDCTNNNEFMKQSQSSIANEPIDIDSNQQDAGDKDTGDKTADNNNDDDDDDDDDDEEYGSFPLCDFDEIDKLVSLSSQLSPNELLRSEEKDQQIQDAPRRAIRKEDETKESLKNGGKESLIQAMNDVSCLVQRQEDSLSAQNDCDNTVRDDDCQQKQHQKEHQRIECKKDTKKIQKGDVKKSKSASSKYVEKEDAKQIQKGDVKKSKSSSSKFVEKKSNNTIEGSKISQEKGKDQHEPMPTAQHENCKQHEISISKSRKRSNLSLIADTKNMPFVNNEDGNGEEEELTQLIEASIEGDTSQEQQSVTLSNEIKDDTMQDQSKKQPRKRRRRKSSADLSDGGKRPRRKSSADLSDGQQRSRRKSSTDLSDGEKQRKKEKKGRENQEKGGDSITNSTHAKLSKITEHEEFNENKDVIVLPKRTNVVREKLSRPRSSSITSLENNNRRSHSPMLSHSYTRQSTSTIASTSAKAGLSVIKNTKLKRLWPDSFVITKKIMKWSPPEIVFQDNIVHFRGPLKTLGKKNDLTPIPSTFRDSPDIIKHVTPHILVEGINSLHQEYMENSKHGVWTRNIFNLTLRSCTPVEPKTSSSATARLYEFAFHFDSNNVRPPTNLGEIFALYSPSWDKSTCCLAFIGSNEINSTFLSDQKYEDEDSYDLCKLWVSVSNTHIEHSGWLPENEMPAKNSDGSFVQEKFYAINVGTCTDVMRQYEALKSLDYIKPNLKKAIFCDAKDGFAQKPSISTSLPPSPTKPSSVIAQVWDIISKQTNAYQLSAIENIMSGKAKENITLLQGPPGTGKTLTVVALVSALLNGSVPIPGAKNPRTAGTKVQIGKAISTSSSPSSSKRARLLNTPVTRRILICSPSNQTVDELAWKLHNNAIGTNGIVGSFNIIRFGMLPGEARHDGRGRSNGRNRGLGFKQTKRDKFLHDINLENIINKIADGRERNDFAHCGNSKSHNAASKRQSRFINYTVERQKKLSQCHVICTTLSGAGSKAFAEAVSRDEFPQSEFDAVIIDEACQGSEMACLIPLKFNPNAVILVGDPKQLPVMSFSRDAERCKADRSLFERLYENGWPVHFLRYQYRMHQDIASFPSRMFYDNLLITSDSVHKRGPAIWHHHDAFPPYLFWSLGGAMKRGRSGGLSNSEEANFVCKLLLAFKFAMSGVRDISIGVISFYNDQVSLINKSINGNHALFTWMSQSNISLQVSTVDGFQGSEKDIIMLSCVRSKWHGKNTRNEIGFLKDFRRVNVALTRAKYSLWILGNCNVLGSDPLWDALISDIRNRNLMTESTKLEHFMEKAGTGRSMPLIEAPRARNRKNRRQRNKR